jgi:DNA-binding response OmpR family regulator
MRVLIAEDELRLADAIARGLRRQGMAVDLAPDGDQALVKARMVRYDVLVLDRDLPGVHGDDVCRTVRGERPDTGILMLTAAGALEEVIDGLSLGADDYLAKPFRFAELVARIHALARRATPSRPPVLHHADLELDPARRRLTRAGRELELARKEFAVLEALMSAEGSTVSSEQLLERVWDEHTDPFTNVVRMTIMTLRRKLGEPPVVETVTGWPDAALGPSRADDPTAADRPIRDGLPDLGCRAADHRLPAGTQQPARPPQRPHRARAAWIQVSAVGLRFGGEQSGVEGRPQPRAADLRPSATPAAV